MIWILRMQDDQSVAPDDESQGDEEIRGIVATNKSLVP